MHIKHKTSFNFKHSKKEKKSFLPKGDYVIKYVKRVCNLN